jgi:hypothetical protein
MLGWSFNSFKRLPVVNMHLNGVIRPSIGLFNDKPDWLNMDHDNTPQAQGPKYPRFSRRQ